MYGRRILFVDVQMFNANNERGHFVAENQQSKVSVKFRQQYDYIVVKISLEIWIVYTRDWCHIKSYTLHFNRCLFMKCENYNTRMNLIRKKIVQYIFV